IGVTKVVPLYKSDGTINTDWSNSDQNVVNFSILNLQVDTEGKSKSVKQGVQLNDLAFSNLFTNGVPQDYTKGDWEDLTEEAKVNSSPIYKTVKVYEDALKDLTLQATDEFYNLVGIKVNPETNEVYLTG